MSNMPSLIYETFTSQTTPLSVRQAALERANRDPTIPLQRGTTASFWMKDKHPGFDKTEHEKLPDLVDVAIIGSGITGLSVAHTLLSSTTAAGSPRLSVGMFEARDVCSGATGRNGGHLLETAGEYLEFKQAFGKDDAKKLMRFRRGHMDAMQELVGDNAALREITQLREVEFVSVYVDLHSFDEAVKNLEEFKRDMPDEARSFAAHRGEELAKTFGLSKHAIGVITGSAGAVWPYRLVTHSLDGLLQRHPQSFFLRQNCPVTSIEVASDRNPSSHPYRLTTAKGTLCARHVVHCTNAHVGHLVPGLRGRVIPLRGQMSAQGPGRRFVSQGSERSWLLNYPNGFDYLTQLPKGGQGSAEELMLGGARSSMPYQGIDEIGRAMDDKLHWSGDIHLSGALSAIFGRENWGSSEGVKWMWTGIMGFTLDGLPWVGELPASLTNRLVPRGLVAGEWAAAGFCGEGMVQAWGSGKAITLMLLQKEEVSVPGAIQQLHEWFPSQLAITEERIVKGSLPTRLADGRMSRL